ncbi:hypothetical protein RhiirC2_783538 [Rhizophagus irregularis]|uniref:Uncharacterized protein n=1 Tax=Rhizophagus irregularis TaxID=588596 RepID=A0A2N1N0I1_9GLOM|nr:hypothetical protein RhiirC2_783538 [Rhizophagus irregularis]
MGECVNGRRRGEQRPQMLYNIFLRYGFYSTAIWIYGCNKIQIVLQRSTFSPDI